MFMPIKEWTDLGKGRKEGGKRYQFLSLFKNLIISSNLCITVASSHKEFPLISNKNRHM